LHAAIHVTTIVTPPGRERTLHSTGTSNGKTQKEDHDLGSTIESSGNEIVPPDELRCSILSQIELTKEANCEENPDGRVDSNDEVSEVPQDDGEIEVGPDSLVGEEFGHEVEWEWNGESEEVGDADPLVTGAKGE